MKGHRRKEMHGGFLVSVGNKLTHLGLILYSQNRQDEKNIYMNENWLMRLWRLTSPKICSWLTGNPGELAVWFQSEGLKI